MKFILRVVAIFLLNVLINWLLLKIPFMAAMSYGLSILVLTFIDIIVIFIAIMLGFFDVD